jgi:vacuolar-type H+-ATPase subunit D/Vma8
MQNYYEEIALAYLANSSVTFKDVAIVYGTTEIKIRQTIKYGITHSRISVKLSEGIYKKALSQAQRYSGTLCTKIKKYYEKLFEMRQILEELEEVNSKINNFEVNVIPPFDEFENLFDLEARRKDLEKKLKGLK